MKLFVGIDVSSQEREACFMNPDGNKLETLKVKNDLHGASHLRDRIVAMADKQSSSEIHIGLEATSVYNWHPAMYMHQDPALQKRKAKVFTINPKLISKFREAYPDLDFPVHSISGLDIIPLDFSARLPFGYCNIIN